MTNNPVPLDRPHVYAFSTKRLVLLASMVVLLIALGMMLGIRIERQQQAQVVTRRPLPAAPAKKAAPLPTGNALKKKKAPPAGTKTAPTPKAGQSDVAPAEEKKTVATTTSVASESEPAPKPVAAPEKQSQPTTDPTTSASAVEAQKPAAPETTVRRGHYAVQVESSQDKSRADSQADILNKKGLKAYVEEVDIEGKGLYYRVMVGPFQTKKQAQEARAILNEDSRFTGSFIKYLP